MKRKLYRIFGVIICIVIVSITYVWDGTMHKKGIFPTEAINNIEYTNYSALDGKYTFKLPSNWDFKEKDLGSKEVVYHGDFSSPDNKIRGIVQVWNFKTPLGQFLKDSKLGEVGVIEYKYYKIEEIRIGNLKGYFIDYSRKGNDGKYYIGNEYFIPKNENEFFRMSFFVPEKYYTPDLKTLFNSIVSRTKIEK